MNITGAVRVPASSGTYSLYSYLKCKGAKNCSNIVTNTEEFVITCDSIVVECVNTITNSATTPSIDYTDLTTSPFSYIYCNSTTSCTNTLSGTNAIVINCNNSYYCSNEISSATYTTLSSTKLFPHILCTNMKGDCINNIASVDIVRILCSSTNAIDCNNTLTSVESFDIDCTWLTNSAS